MLVRATVIAQDDSHRLWSSVDVQEAHAWLLKHHKRIPTFRILYASFGKEVVDAEVERFLEERTRYLSALNALVEIDEKSNECHKCGKPDTERYTFGLAEMLLDKRHWWETIASVAISAITVPTLGRGMISFPGRTRRARILKFRLRLCHSCARKSKTIFGTVREESYAAHPCWERAHELGFRRFLSRDKVKHFK
jgi:hypothetical protein